MREVAILASSGTATEHDMNNYGAQLVALFHSVQAIVATTRYNHTADGGMGKAGTTTAGDTNYATTTASFILPLAITNGDGDTTVGSTGSTKEIPIQATIQSGVAFRSDVGDSGDDYRGSFMVHIYDLINLQSLPTASDASTHEYIEQDDYTNVASFATTTEMVEYIDKIDADILKLRNLIRRADSEFKSLNEYKTALLRYVKNTFSELDRKRVRAKEDINDELCSILKTIGYLNVCIYHNGD